MYQSQINSHVAEPNALYSTSEEDLKIIVCFFVFHDTCDEPIKRQWPDVDFLESTHPTQSA